ncbi:MAG: hypothetical protein QOG68_1060 [Solirubrobacteraceae bacterium]|nr:hypothetical protein [Solirubrobacteraceae bacterium]
MRSARPLIHAGLVVALLSLGGCATTQDRNARAKLAATRLLASRKATPVTVPNPDVTIGKVALVHHDGAVAVVVELHNASANALTDLPINVGVETHGRRSFLNRRAGVSYFQSHVTAIAARGDTTWVFTSRHATSLSGHPFAIVGVPVSPPISSATSLPALVAAPASGFGPSVRVRVGNPTGVPQSELPDYALARRGTRYVAAGRATLAHLGTGQHKQLELRLIGSTGGAQLSVQAQPSMFK